MIQGLGEKLIKLRLIKGLSQKEVAAAIGVSSGVISNYETGERTPSVEKLMSLAVLYHCSTDYLLGIEKAEKQLDCSMLTDSQMHLLQVFLDEMTTSSGWTNGSASTHGRKPSK